MRKSTPIAILEIILGLLLVVLGFLSLVNPGSTLEAFVVVYGLGALLSGVIYIVFYIRMTRHVGFAPLFTLIGGIVDIILGILLLSNIAAGEAAMTVIFPLWFIMSCAVNLFNLGGVKFLNRGYYYFSLAANIIGILVGILLLINPFASAAALAYTIGFMIIVIGVYSVMIAIMRLSNKS